MADVLFVHNNFPGQFGFLAESLCARGHRCAAISSQTGRSVDGIEVRRWSTSRGTTPKILPSAARFETDLIRGGAAASVATELKAQGFDPSLIVGHPGWGEMLFLREIFPRAKQVVHAEYYYRSEDGDVGFDPEFSAPSDTPYTVYAKNAALAMAMAEADAIVTPTEFQRSRLPPGFRDRAVVIHEGVDTDLVRRQPSPSLTLSGGMVLDGTCPVITLINRKLEPLRGLHIFMRALPRLMEAVPNAEVLIIGRDEPGGYGKAAPAGSTWGQVFLSEIGPRIDRSRLHFVGQVPHEVMIAALSVSTAHVYYTYPFVLSWSLLEAMAAECLIIGSNTAPVRDAVTNGKDGILLDFFDVDALSEALIDACQEPDKFAPLKHAARQTVLDRFDRSNKCEPLWLALVEDLLAAPANSAATLADVKRRPAPRRRHER